MDNKVKSILIALFFSSLTLGAMAQEESSTIEIPKTSSYVNASFAAGIDVYSAGLGISRTHGLFARKKLRIGYGLRAHGFAGNNLNYITAPARLTLSDPALIDTFNIESPVTAGISAVIHLGYQITPKLMVGFNIDVIGIGFGASSIGTFQSSDDVIYPLAVRATPTLLNLLLVGDNDIGQLKSQFTVGYHINEKFRIGAGLDFHFSEYTTINELTNLNDRFRYKAMMGFLGVSYNIESK